MILFPCSIIIFNWVVYKMDKHLSKNQIVHIWIFTSFLETIFDIFVDEKWYGYWYFAKGIDWTNIIVYLLLLPPVNVMIVNWFPFKASWKKKTRYITYWWAFSVGYEGLTLLPEPLGYFHYGWWNVWYSIVLDPILMLILPGYYGLICKIEKDALQKAIKRGML